MTTFTQPRQPAGSPTGGEFACETRAESSLSLPDWDPDAPAGGEVRDALLVGRQAKNATSAQVEKVLAALSHEAEPSRERVDAKRALRRAAQHAQWSNWDQLLLTDGGWCALAEYGENPDASFVGACRDASVAVAGRTMIGHYGFTQYHYDTLTRAWQAGFPDTNETADTGPLWKEDAVSKLRADAYVFDNARSVMLSAGSSPADSYEAARRALGTQDIRFSHLKNNHPVYEIA